jgi:hypothetical protein
VSLVAAEDTSINPKGTLFYLVYLGVFTLVITPGTSASAMLLLVFAMMLVNPGQLRSHPYNRDVVRLHLPIVGDQRRAFDLRLRNEHAIERIAVVLWKGREPLGVCECDG